MSTRMLSYFLRITFSVLYQKWKRIKITNLQSFFFLLTLFFLDYNVMWLCVVFNPESNKILNHHKKKNVSNNKISNLIGDGSYRFPTFRLECVSSGYHDSSDDWLQPRVQEWSLWKLISHISGKSLYFWSWQ